MRSAFYLYRDFFARRRKRGAPGLFGFILGRVGASPSFRNWCDCHIVSSYRRIRLQFGSHLVRLLTLEQHDIRIVVLTHTGELGAIRGPSECQDGLVFKIG